MRKEWLLPNGRGGYASGTFAGINTRKYHGLLISGFDDKGSRYLHVGALEEKVTIGEHRYFFSAHKYYADTIYPRGFMHLVDYGQAPSLVWFRFGNFHECDLSILKVIRVHKGYEAAQVEYFFQGDLKGVDFCVYPLVTARNIHQVMTQAPYHSERGDEWTGSLPFVFERVETTPGGWFGLTMKNKVDQRLSFILSKGSEYTDKQDWYHSFQYDSEMGRGYEYIEDLYCPGKFSSAGDRLRDPLRLVFAMAQEGKAIDGSVPDFDGREMSCQDAFKLIPSQKAESRDIIQRWKGKLSSQADDFWVENPGGHTGIMAGYPWFGLWSRDMLQSMEGLLLISGSASRAKKMLLTLAQQSRGGLVPNILEESDRRYEFLGDSSLWFIVALFQYIRVTRDQKALEMVWPTVQEIIVRYLHQEGEHPVMDQDGLIMLAGDGSKAATWMDAIVFDRAVTPRYGKPVEIQALWYNSLMILGELSREYQLSYPLAADAIRQRNFPDLDELCSYVKTNFLSKFVHPDLGYLADVVGVKGTSWQVRPNQLFASGLPFPLLTRPQAKLMLRTVERELLTPYGLKTLSPKDMEYKGYYGGSQVDRDRAYHQGTVWPWLLGMYGRSLTYAWGPKAGQARIEEILKGLFCHIESLGIEYIPEIFSADDGHADGAFHQAWSVAEILGMIGQVKIPSAKTKIQPKRRLRS